MIRTVALALITWGLGAAPVIAADLSTWAAATSLRCPSRHLEYIGDGYWDEVLGAYERTLGEVSQQRILALADYGRRCSREAIGFS